MRINIKAPEYFISAVSGEMLLAENTASPAASIPPQLPAGVKEEEIKGQAQGTSTTTLAVSAVQLVA